MNIHFTMYLTIELLQVPHYREKIRVSVSFPCNFIHPKAGSLQVPHPCISPMCLIARSLFMNGQWAWMVVPQWIWKSYNRAPPPHAKKKQIIHRYYQVIVKSTSACAKVLIEHGSMTKKCKEHALWGPQQLGSRQIPLFWWGKGGHGSGCSSCPPLSKHTS